MRLYPFFVTPSSPINALTSNLFRVRLGIKRIVTPHSTYLSHSLACPLCVPLRLFVYSHTCMSVDPVGKARSKSDYGFSFYLLPHFARLGQKKEPPQTSESRMWGIFSASDSFFRRVELVVADISSFYILIAHPYSPHTRNSTNSYLQEQRYILFPNYQNFYQSFFIKFKGYLPTPPKHKQIHTMLKKQNDCLSIFLSHFPLSNSLLTSPNVRTYIS